MLFWQFVLALATLCLISLPCAVLFAYPWLYLTILQTYSTASRAFLKSRIIIPFHYDGIKMGGAGKRRTLRTQFPDADDCDLICNVPQHMK